MRIVARAGPGDMSALSGKGAAMKSRARNGVLIAGASGAAAVLGLAICGWMLEGRGLSDAVYQALQAFVLGDVYRSLETAGPGRWLLELARAGGAFMAFYAVALLLWANLRVWRIRMTARNRRDHLIVVGETPFADRLSETISGPDLKLNVVQLRDPLQPVTRSGRLIRLPFSGFDQFGLDSAGAESSRRLIIAMSDDGASVDLTLAAQGRYPELSILTRLQDGCLLQNLHHLPGGQLLRSFSEAEAAARDIVRRHPLFLLAEDYGHERMHALLVGDDDWVEALMAEIILSCRTLRFGRPALVLGVSDPQGLRQRFAIRYPELSMAADLSFIALEATTCCPLNDAPLEHVTAAYVAFEDSARSLATALSLRRQIGAWPTFDGPVFVRVINDGVMDRPVGGLNLPALTLVPFGTVGDINHAVCILSRATEDAEKKWHDAYLELEPDSEAAVRWEALSEGYRLSNRRAIAHAYAKLFDAGFDLRPWLARDDLRDEIPALAEGEELFRDEAELMRLSELEHERWNADRRLQGWRHGPKTIRKRRIHDGLVDFRDLPAAIQALDIKLIQTLNDMLPRKPEGVMRSRASI